MSRRSAWSSRVRNPSSGHGKLAKGAKTISSNGKLAKRMKTDRRWTWALCGFRFVESKVGSMYIHKQRVNPTRGSLTLDPNCVKFQCDISNRSAFALDFRSSVQAKGIYSTTVLCLFLVTSPARPSLYCLPVFPYLHQHHTHMNSDIRPLKS